MLSSRALRWLHRVGYVATAIVTLELVGVGTLASYAWLQQRQIASAGRERTRTHAGPLSARIDEPRYVLDDALRLLAKLPALDQLGPDAVRFVAMPSFGRQWFAIALRADAGNATGVIVTVQRSGTDDLGAEARQDFSMPLRAFRAMTARADRLSDGWGGDGLWLDGTPIAFERVRGAGVTSGIGNSATHYAKLAAVLRDGLAQYVPEVERLDGEWMQREVDRPG